MILNTLLVVRTNEIPFETNILENNEQKGDGSRDSLVESGAERCQLSLTPKNDIFGPNGYYFL